MENNIVVENDVLIKCETNKKSIIILDGITKIEKNAFDRCENLESIILPKCLKYIGCLAFYKCMKLEKVFFEGTIEDV